MDDHSSGTRVATCFAQPTRAAGPEKPDFPCEKSHHPYSVLLPVGFAMPLPLPDARCALTAPFHPYPSMPKHAKGGSFSVALSLGSPPPDVIRHRFSVEPGLSSTAAFRLLRQRSPSQLASAGLGICCGYVNKTLNYPKTGPCSAPVCLGANDD